MEFSATMKIGSITIRPANPQDVPLAVECFRLSMDEFADQMFGSVPGHSTDAVLADLFSYRKGRFSYRYGNVAEWDGQPVGLLVAYPSSLMPRLDLEMGRPLLSRFGLMNLLRLLRSLRSYAGVREVGRGEYYVSNLAVSRRFQGRGIGTCLLAYGDEQAQKLHLKKCSLLVALNNDGARRLYERAGYCVLRTWEIRHADGRVDGTRRMVKLLPVIG